MSPSIPKTQRALQVVEIGKPLVLTTSHPVPTPGPAQVLLRTTVAGLNPHDQKARDRGLFIADSLPALLSNDAVGTVVALGPGVTKYALGARVLSQPGFDGVFAQNPLQEYCVADVERSCEIPEGISDDEACTLPTNIFAGVVGTFDGEKGLGIPAPWSAEAGSFDCGAATVLVWGGGSNCGRFEVQLLKLAGIGRIVVVGGDEKELRGYGATHVIDRHGGEEVVEKRIRDVVGDDLVYAYDAVNTIDKQYLSVNALSSSKRGRMARLLPTGPMDETNVRERKGGYDVISVFGSSQAFPGLCGPFWEKLPGYLEQGQIKPLKFVVKGGLEADKVNAVLDAYRDGERVEKSHFHISS